MSSDVSSVEAHTTLSGRNVVLCFDGTGDWVGVDETNVAQIFSSLVKDESQLTFYDGGVGTLTNPQALTVPQRVALRLIDLGVATGLREKVLNGYNFLVRNYQKDDRIFLFGFSRGAYTARLVASMIHNFGLVRPEHEVLSQYLWQTLESIPPGRDIDEAQSPIGAFKRTANRLKRDFARQDVQVHFMGLFDTVSSVGVLRRFNVYPNTDKNPSVLRVCHAVSIDEQRNAFPEALFHPQQPGLTEVWFPGVHRDVGGGLPKGRRRIADEALAWIAQEASDSGLYLTGKFTPDPKEEPLPNYPSYDPYVFLGFYPMKMFVKRVSDFRFIWPNFRHLRTVPENALVHSIVHKIPGRIGYAPVNFPREPRSFPDQIGQEVDAHYKLRPRTFSSPDFLGTLLGTTLLFLIWNQIAGSPLGDSWPVVFKDANLLGLEVTDWHLELSLQPRDVTLATIAKALFFLFFLGQFAGQALTERLPKALRPRPEGFLPIAGVIVAAVVFAGTYRLNSQALATCLFAGTAIAVIGQSPGLPTLPTDRTLPCALWAGIGGALFYALLRPVLFDAFGQTGSVWAMIALILLAVAIDVIGDRLVQLSDAGEQWTNRRAKANPQVKGANG
jgi:hypothetical protein